jgi:hypothetical protein
MLLAFPGARSSNLRLFTNFLQINGTLVSQSRQLPASDRPGISASIGYSIKSLPGYHLTDRKDALPPSDFGEAQPGSTHSQVSPAFA